MIGRVCAPYVDEVACLYPISVTASDGSTAVDLFTFGELVRVIEAGGVEAIARDLIVDPFDPSGVTVHGCTTPDPEG